MHQIKSEILSNREIIPLHFVMGLYSPEIAREANPGQFLHIRIEDKNDPLLRRPFSIHRIEDERVEILYKVVGEGTKILSQKRPSQKIDLLGPLGRGFKINSGVERVVLVAGGVGGAPLYFLVSRLIAAQVPELSVFIGAENKERLLYEEQFRDLAVDVQIATEDGSKGFKGLISDLFASSISAESHTSSTVVCACGPLPMMREIASISKGHGITCYVSLEQRMGCGIGACLGCVIRGEKGYVRVCKDGPVFDAQDIDWKWMQ